MIFSKGYTKLKNKTEQIVESVKTVEVFSEKKEFSLPYAYPCDNYMDSILSNTIVRKALQLFVDKYCKKQIQTIKSSGLFVLQNNFPRFHTILESCYKALNVKEIPDVYITNQLKGINALSVGTDKAPIILISQKSVISLTDGELKFMIGHELGHILQKNLMCHTIKGVLDSLNNKSEVLGPIVSNIIDVPLNQWYRCTEYTADRAGFICCGNIKDIQKLFTRLCRNKIGSTDQIMKYFELSKAHPLYHNRLIELERYVTQHRLITIN